MNDVCVKVCVVCVGSHVHAGTCACARECVARLPFLLSLLCMGACLCTCAHARERMRPVGGGRRHCLSLFVQCLHAARTRLPRHAKAPPCTPFDCCRACARVCMLFAWCVVRGVWCGVCVSGHVVAGQTPGPGPRVVVADSREGWVDSVRLLLASHLHGGPCPEFDLSRVRPAGAPIKARRWASAGRVCAASVRGEWADVRAWRPCLLRSGASHTWAPARLCVDFLSRPRTPARTPPLVPSFAACKIPPSSANACMPDFFCHPIPLPPCLKCGVACQPPLLPCFVGPSVPLIDRGSAA